MNLKEISTEEIVKAYSDLKSMKNFHENIWITEGKITWYNNNNPHENHFKISFEELKNEFLLREEDNTPMLKKDWIKTIINIQNIEEIIKPINSIAYDSKIIKNLNLGLVFLTSFLIFLTCLLLKGC